MEREWSVSRQHPWTMALLWHGTSRYLCSWVSESSSNNLFCSPLKSPTLLTCFMNLGFRNWTWALKLSSTWTPQRNSYGLKLWRGVCIQKPSTRGWEELDITALPIITKWEFKDTEWMFSLSILYVSSSLSVPFFCSGPNYTTCWHDARGLCQEIPKTLHERSGCRARWNRNHGENGLFTIKQSRFFQKTQFSFR